MFCRERVRAGRLAGAPVVEFAVMAARRKAAGGQQGDITVRRGTLPSPLPRKTFYSCSFQLLAVYHPVAMPWHFAV